MVWKCRDRSSCRIFGTGVVEMNRQIFQGDVIEQLAQFPDGSIDCIISSPPYWGLRDYGTGKWVGGDPKCDHSAIRHKTREERGGLSKVQSGNQGGFGDENKWTSDNCPTCGAIREDNQLGLEPDFHDYLNKMQTIMDELKRILKNTGTCWINLGDTYSGSGKGAGYDGAKESWRFDKKPEINETITAKSRIGIPERFYINCIDGGWIARNHIVWTKNNSMPSSVKDRFTNKWESVFFFAKNKKYYFNLDAVREKSIVAAKPFNVRVRDSEKQRFLQKATKQEILAHNPKGERKYKKMNDLTLGPKSHAQWEKRVQNARDIGMPHDNTLGHPKGKNPGDLFQIDGNDTQFIHSGQVRLTKNGTVPSYDAHPNGKNPGDIFRINTKPFKEAHFATFPPALPQKILKCACPKDGIVLDPFFGSGTVGLVAEQMGLQWCGIELNPEYIEIAKKRLDPYTAIQKLEAFV